MLSKHSCIVSPKRPLIGNTTPDAVVQPKDEDEIIEIVKWVASNDMALTPRGKAPSGYGGAIRMKSAESRFITAKPAMNQ